MPGSRDRDRSPTLETLTPVPTQDLALVSRSISKVGTAVTRIESSVDTIKNDLLPPVAGAAFEARDGVLRLNGRVTAIEGKPAPEHECEEKNRQTRQDNDIAEARVKTQSTSKLVWWLIGIAVVVGGSAISFAILSRTTAAENSMRLESHSGDITRHEREIDALQKAQQRDRETYLREMRDLPRQVKQAAQSAPTVEAMEDAADDLHLTPREQRQLMYLLKTARTRGGNGSDDR